MKKNILFALYLIIPFQSCSTSKNMADNQVSRGHYRLYTYPQKQKKEKIDKDRYQKITILGINDFKGNNDPQSLPIKNKFEEQRVIRSGGIAAMKSYIDLMKKTQQNPVLVVDAGSFLDPEHDFSKNLFLYNYLEVDAANLGTTEYFFKHERSDQLASLKHLTSKAKFPILNNNITYLLTDTQLKDVGVRPYSLQEKNGLKIGIIGTTTPDVSQEQPGQTIPGVYIENVAKSIITSANSLRRMGAQLIILLLNKGIDCTSLLSKELDISDNKVNFDPYETRYCDSYKNKFFEALRLLPPKTIDVAFTSGVSSKVANFIQEVPVLQNKGYGQFLSWIDLYYDKKHLVVASEKTKIHQPIHLCHNFLADNQDCYISEEIDDKEITPATFLGEKVIINSLSTIAHSTDK